MFQMVIANIFGIFIFLFLLWKYLKDDYHYEKIFNLGFVGLISLAAFYLLNYFFNSTFWFWIILLGLSLSLFITIKKQKMQFFESFESLSIGLLFLLDLYYLFDSIVKSSLTSFLAFWVTLLFIFIFFLIKSYYRSFTWYKSGRVGIAGVTTLLIFFITRAIVSIFVNNVASFAGDFEVYFSGSTALLIIFLMYNLFKQNE